MGSSHGSFFDAEVKPPRSTRRSNEIPVTPLPSMEATADNKPTARRDAMLGLVYTFLGVVGLLLFAAGFFMLLPQVIVGSPWELLLAILSPRRGWQVLHLIETHIQANWPDTKWVGSVYYAGVGLLLIAAVLFAIDWLLG